MRKDDTIAVLKGVFFAWRFFFFSYSLFFVFSRGVISSFRFFFLAWRYFVFLRGVISLSFFGGISGRQDEKTKWHKPATIFPR